MIDEALAGLASGDLVATPQPAEGITYAAKLDKAEGRLDWRDSAEALDRRIRAFTPWPGAYFEVAGERGRERVKVLAATPAAADGRRAEARRVGQECVGTGRSEWAEG